nr:hypothetical protein [Bacteroidia bacterium]
MRKLLLLTLFSFVLGSSQAQIIVIGHTQLNGTPITGIQVSVVSGKTIEQSINTSKKPTFNLQLSFGKKYNIVVQHPDCPVMYFEIDGTKVPADKQSIRMIHELDLPFYFKNDEDVDTTVFSKPCQLVFFDGKSKMVTDTAYITSFYKKVIKAQKPKTVNTVAENIEVPATIAARVLLNDYKLAVKNQVINIYDAKGNKLRTTKTDRFGNFAVTNIIPSQMHKVELVPINGNISNSTNVTLYNATQNHTAKTTCTNNK